jgi:hypothetical protein
MKIAVFRVRREYFDQIRVGTKNVELRKTHLIGASISSASIRPTSRYSSAGNSNSHAASYPSAANQNPEVILGRPLSE